MKGLKKLIISLLALVMVMGASMTAFAASGTITIKKAAAGQTYDAYRVFDYVPADEANAKDGGGIYKLASKFSGLTSYTYDYKDAEGKDVSVAMSSFFKVGDNDILDTFGLKTEEDAKVFGKAVLAYVKANGIANDGSTTATEDGVATIAVSEYGYYVVDSSLGSAVAVDTTTPNAVIEEKNKVPDLKKVIQEQQGENVVDLTGNNAQIGDVVNFAVTAELKKGGENYEIVDKTTEGLDIIDNSFDISFETVEVAHDAVSVNTDKHGFSLKFTAVPSEDTVCTVTYQAKVNVSAKISPKTNDNEAYLKYGNNSETTHKITTTMTYPVLLKKVVGDTDTVLAGAHFNIYRKSDNTLVHFTKKDENGTKYVVDPTGSVTDIVTVDAGFITLDGFDAETYVFVETQAPVGYNLIVADEEYTLPDKTTTVHYQEGTVTTKATLSEPYVVTVKNYTGSLLPSTGGVGTTIFYILGGILIVAGAAYFIVRRKANAE